MTLKSKPVIKEEDQPQPQATHIYVMGDSIILLTKDCKPKMISPDGIFFLDDGGTFAMKDNK